MSEKHPQATSLSAAASDKAKLQSKVEIISDAIEATGIKFDLQLLRAFYRYWLKRLGTIDPPCIKCSVTDGPNANNFHNEFRTTYDAYGYPEFRLGFTVSYYGASQYCYVHINRHSYRSGKQRNHFNIGGIITFKMPGEAKAKHYHFTGDYSTKSNKGQFRIYTTPINLEDTRKPSDFEKEERPTKKRKSRRNEEGT